MINKVKKTNILVIGLVLGLLIMGLLAWAGPMFLISNINRTIVEKQKFILYLVNHQILCQLARDFAWPKNGKSAYQRFGDEVFESGNTNVPPALWIVGPARIVLNKDRLDFEYGGALMHYGISIFPPHEEGSGTIKLGDGIWFYSENGRYPSKL